MVKSVVPPTFFRRSIGDHAQLSPTPIGGHVQLFRDQAQLLRLSGAPKASLRLCLGVSLFLRVPEFMDF